MNLNLRKYLIGLVSLAALLIIYVLYGRISQTPRITIGADEGFVDTLSYSEVDNYDSEAGKIGDVGVVAIRKPRFLHRNKFNEVDREFGFEELLHEAEDQWEIDKPLGQCHGSGKKIEQGEDYFAALVETDQGLQRRDFCADYWQNEKPNAFCHWKTKLPQPDRKKQLFVDDEMLMTFFDRLETETGQEKVNFRFVLALILAPLVIKNSTISLRPNSAALCRGVQPLISTWFRLNPSLTRSSRILIDPPAAATRIN